LPLPELALDHPVDDGLDAFFHDSGKVGNHDPLEIEKGVVDVRKPVGEVALLILLVECELTLDVGEHADVVLEEVELGPGDARVLSRGHGTFHFSDVAGVADLRRPLHDPEEVLPRLAMAVLPPWLAGLVISAIMAAIMSTASGFLLSVTSSMTEDVYHRLFRPAAGQKELVLVSRAVTLALGASALVLALGTNPLDPRATVYKLVLYGWGGLAGCFSAPVTLALFYRGMTRAGCLAGMLSGALTVLLWRNVPALSSVAYEVLPAMAISALSILVMSRLTREP
jgi:Na+(H+)/acetate symporter ActP